jgi:hypothetical protein
MKFLKADGSEEPVTADAAYIDGYHFGDRLLEGVMFEIKLCYDGTPLCTGVRDSDQAYMEKFSMKQMLEWTRDAVNYAKSDVDLVLADGTDVYLADA